VTPARRAWLAGGAALAVTAGFAAWAGTQYAAAASGPALSQGAVRDAALRAGTREIADLNSVSARSVGAWQRRWLNDTAGGEHAKIAQTDSAAAAQIAKVKTSSAATVTAAALTSLSVPPGGRAGSAGLIATVTVVQTNASGVSNTVRNRYTATLTLTPAGWKISSLTGG
jgi:Mce-associated membrane protein